MEIKALGYMGFSVKDVPEWRRYLTKLAGLMETPCSTNEQARFRMDSRNWRIGVEQGDLDDLAFAGFEVANPGALEKMRARLQEAGVKFISDVGDLAKKRDVLDLIAFKDPFGMQIEIFYGAGESYEKPFVSPTGVTGFQTGDQGLGHYFYAVPDVVKGLSFYVDVLGFKLSDVIDIPLGPDMTVRGHFLHCNGRHHTMAIAEAPMPKRIHHFMLQAATLDDVGHACDRLDGFDYQTTDSNLGVAEEKPNSYLTTTIGRHVNDHMVSFYARTPSGFEMEFGWGARAVDDCNWTMTRHSRTAMWGHKSLRKQK